MMMHDKQWIRDNDAYIVDDKWLAAAETWHAVAIAEDVELVPHAVVGIYACVANNEHSYEDMDDDDDDGVVQVLVDLSQVAPCCCNKWERQDQTQDMPEWWIAVGAVPSRNKENGDKQRVKKRITRKVMMKGCVFVCG